MAFTREKRALGLCINQLNPDRKAGGDMVFCDLVRYTENQSHLSNNKWPNKLRLLLFIWRQMRNVSSGIIMYQLLKIAYSTFKIMISKSTV